MENRSILSVPSRADLFPVRLVLLLFPFLISLSSTQAHSVIVDTSIRLVDGNVSPYNQLKPGDTIFLAAGERNKILFRYLHGAEGKPICIINKGGAVVISTNDYYAISVVHSSYFSISGTGEPSISYGIMIKKVLGGAGIGINDLTTDFELDHLSIENCLTSGIMAKTEPDCAFPQLRDHFIQMNTLIHDNYIAYTGNEGMYIGSASYSGKKMNCNGVDTVLYPPVLRGVQVYNNIVIHTGWDAIQVSSAVSGCAVYNNKITYDSQAEMNNQMAGILLGGGSKCECYNNRITDGKGVGIENHGLGGNRIFNNVIVNAGQSYRPDDPTAMKHGIFISDVSAQPDSSVYILFNTIINPKSDGIRFQSVKTRKNLIASNLIIHPGNFGHYAVSGVSPEKAYIMISNPQADVAFKNNFLSQGFSQAGVSNTTYEPFAGSPLINAAYADSRNVNFDILGNLRPKGIYSDIGAFEYQGSPDSPALDQAPVYKLYPNPAQSVVSFRYTEFAGKKNIHSIYTSTGVLVSKQDYFALFTGIQELRSNVSFLPKGSYVYKVETSDSRITVRFIKL